MRKHIFFGILAAAATGLSAQVFVSPRGNDRASGTASAPVRSVQRAIMNARQGNHQVVLLDGVYRLTTPLVLTAEDNDLLLQAAPGARPVLSGGVRLPRWRPVPGRKNLWFTKMPAQVAAPRALYVNGFRATRTRGLLPVELTQTATGYRAETAAMSRWRNASQMEMVYTGGNALWSLKSVGLGDWTEPRCPVASIATTVITMAEPCWTNSTRRLVLPGKQRSANLVGPVSIGETPIYLENAYELLGTPGQFYADAKSRTIFYTPRGGEAMRDAEAVLPVLEELLQVTGGSAITVRGVGFEATNWRSPDTGEGFSEIQANYRLTGRDGADKQGLCDLAPGGTCPFAAWDQEPAAVTVQDADGVRFERCSFRHLGAAALRMPSGAHNAVIRGNIFEDISGNGVELGNVDEPMGEDRVYAVGNHIENNLFEHVGAEFQGGIPIVIGYAQHTTVMHNQIDHVPYAGISIGWGGWRDKIALAGVGNRSTGNVIEANLIRDYMLVLSDGGGIYTQGRTGSTLTDGERVQRNVLLNQFGTGHALYTDNGAAMETIRDNVIFNSNHDNWGSRHKDYYDGGSGSDNDPTVVEGNFWEQGDQDSDAKQVLEHNNTIIARLEQAPAEILTGAGLEPGYRDLLSIAKFAHAPQPPSRVAVHATPSAIYVTWNPTVDDGGSSVSAYRVLSDGGGPAVTLPAKQFEQDSYVRLGGSARHDVPRFRVVALNSHGESAPSLPSAALQHSGGESSVPPKPIARALIRNGRVSLHITAPKVAKGEAAPFILYYTAEFNGTTQKLTGRRLLTLSGTHTTVIPLDSMPDTDTPIIRLRAVNDAGQSDAAELDVHSEDNAERGN